MGNEDLLKQVTAKAQIWLGDGYDEETKAAVRAMLDNEDKTDLIEAFYKDLEFGTGGLRGIMGAGTNRMNIYTVGAATQGLSNYLKKAFADLPQIKDAWIDQKPWQKTYRHSEFPYFVGDQCGL